ncbi:MAG: hypothetical protein Kow0062_01800 [Acidobacteriota bacterium]
MSLLRSVDPRAAARGLFVGEVCEESFHPFPDQDPDDKEACDLAVEAFREWAAERLDPEEIDRREEIPEQVRREMGELGMLGLTVPEEYGGAGFSYTAYCRFVEEVTRTDASLAVFLGAHLSIGARPLILFGTDEQKRRYLPEVASGEAICAFALTEPGAGSDAGALRTRAVWDAERGEYRLDGNKIWITNGGYAKLFTVFARTEGGPEGAGDRGVSGFLVERGTPGFSNGPSEHKLGIRGTSTTELAFQDVRVPADHRVGPPGEGFQIALETLATGRLSLGAGCAGAAKGCIAAAVAHGRERKQFKKPIISFGMIREKIGRMVARTFAAESAAYLTTGLYDRTNLDLMIETGYCKILGSEVLWDVVNDTIQIVGGIGYMADYPYQRHLRDSRINLIFEGTNEILRLMGTLEGLKEPARRDAERRRAEKAGLAADAVAHAADRGPAGHAPDLRWVADELAEPRDAFADALERFRDGVQRAIARHRRRIVAEQYTLRRLADCAIVLYSMAACLSRTSTRIERDGADRATREILLTRRWIDEGHRRVSHELDALDTRADGYDDAIAELLVEEGRYPAPLFGQS